MSKKDIEFKWDNNKPSLYLPSGTEEEISTVFRELENNEDELKDNISVRWVETLAWGTNSVYVADSIHTDDKELVQNVEHNGKSLNPSVPHMKELSGKELTGKSALVGLLNHLEISKPFRVPLWHSGFWVTLVPPSEGDVIELHRQMLSDKVSLGRSTHGSIFSNMSSIIVDRVSSFIVKHIHDTTANMPVSKLLKYIKVQDLPVLVWGILVTMYPSGVQYKRACLNKECKYIAEDLINLILMLRVDKKYINDRMEDGNIMLESKPKSVSKEDILKYQKTLSPVVTMTLTSDNGQDIDFDMSSPSVEDYVINGKIWIEDIVEMIESNITDNATRDEKETEIMKHARATSMRQYDYWINGLSFNENIVTDKPTIRTLINHLSSEDNIRKEYLKGVLEYINDTTVVVVGVPSYDCPSCSKPQQDENKKDTVFKDFIPVDLLSIFFYLGEQKIQKILER